MSSYYEKYLKYKLKYMDLASQIGAGPELSTEQRKIKSIGFEYESKTGVIPLFRTGNNTFRGLTLQDKIPINLGFGLQADITIDTAVINRLNTDTYNIFNFDYTGIFPADNNRPNITYNDLMFGDKEYRIEYGTEIEVGSGLYNMIGHCEIIQTIIENQIDTNEFYGGQDNKLLINYMKLQYGLNNFFAGMGWNLLTNINELITKSKMRTTRGSASFSLNFFESKCLEFMQANNKNYMYLLTKPDNNYAFLVFLENQHPLTIQADYSLQILNNLKSLDFFSQFTIGCNLEHFFDVISQLLTNISFISSKKSIEALAAEYRFLIEASNYLNKIATEKKFALTLKSNPITFNYLLLISYCKKKIEEGRGLHKFGYKLGIRHSFYSIYKLLVENQDKVNEIHNNALLEAFGLKFSEINGLAWNNFYYSKPQLGETNRRQTLEPGFEMIPDTRPNENPNPMTYSDVGLAPIINADGSRTIKIEIRDYNLNTWLIIIFTSYEKLKNYYPSISDYFNLKNIRLLTILNEKKIFNLPSLPIPIKDQILLFYLHDLVIKNAPESLVEGDPCFKLNQILLDSKGLSKKIELISLKECRKSDNKNILRKIKNDANTINLKENELIRIYTQKFNTKCGRERPCTKKLKNFLRDVQNEIKLIK